uniref:Uncharacterized protein n=1 Tax=Opuntia streptacantha TaxID=393608 RepID=A0A7C9EHU2_OPUST
MNLTFSSEREFITFAPRVIVFATSNAKMEILLPLATLPVKNPLEFKFAIPLPSASNTSTAFSSPAKLALPRNDPFCGILSSPERRGEEGLKSLENENLEPIDSDVVDDGD